MMRSWHLTAAVLGTLTLGAAATTFAAEEPAAPPKAEAEKPAAEAPGAPLVPEVAEVLDKMDAAGKDIKTVRARFDYELNQTLYEDIKKRKGELHYRAPNQLRFEFTDRPQETFVFDGRILYHKNEATRQLIIYEMRLASEPPVDSLEIGKTPFPLPFGQRKEAVLKYFTVTRDAKEEAADKDKRAVLVLDPKKDTQMARDYTKILLWIDPKQCLPTQAKLFDTSKNETTVDFHHIETNKDVDTKLFEKPDVPKDWEVVNHPKEK